MTMRFLGLDLAPGELRLAEGERSVSGVRVTRMARVPLPDAGALAAAVARAPRPATVLSALPLHAGTHRMLQLPFRDRRRLDGVVPLELLGQLPAEPPDVQVAYVAVGSSPDGSDVLAAAVRQADVDARRATLRAAGVDDPSIELAPLAIWSLLRDEPGAVALLVADGPRSSLSLRRDGRLAALRALDGDARDAAGLVTEATWVLRAFGMPMRVVVTGADADGVRDALAAATTAEVVPLAAALAVPLLAAGDADACALAAGLVVAAARRQRGLVVAGPAPDVGPSWRRTAALAASVLLLGALDVALVRTELARREAHLEQAIVETASQALPAVPATTARAALEDAVALRRRLEPDAGGTVLEVLRELSARVPAAIRLDLDELVVEPDAVLLHGRSDSFDAVDAVRRALAASPLAREVTAEETRTTVDGRGVEFRLRVVRRSTLGAPS